MGMTKNIKVGSVVYYKSGFIKGTGVVIRKTDDGNFPSYEVLWQNRSVRSGKFEHCRSTLSIA
jgi:hypothetical protein